MLCDSKAHQSQRHDTIEGCSESKAPMSRKLEGVEGSDESKDDYGMSLLHTWRSELKSEKSLTILMTKGFVLDTHKIFTI